MIQRITADSRASAPPDSRSAFNSARMFVGVWNAEGDPQLREVRPPIEIDEFEISSRHARIKAWGLSESNEHLSKLVTVDAAWTSLLHGRAFPLSRLSLGDIRDDEDLLDRAGTFFAKLDGKFSVCMLESRGRCILATDMLGAGGIFYTHIGSSLFFSSHLGLLLQTVGPVEEDRLGLAALVISSGSMSGLTPFKGIHRLQSTQLLLASPDGSKGSRILVRKYAEPADLLELGSRPGPEDFPSLREGFSALLQESIARESFQGPVAHFLSGGLDSRALGIALRLNSHSNVVSVTYGTKRSRDRRVARTIAPSLGFPNRLVPYSRWDFSTYANVIVDLNGGMSGLQGSHNLVGFEYAGKFADVGILGFLGGPISGSHFGDSESPGFKLAKNVLFPRLRPFSELGILSSEIAEHLSTLERLHSDLADLQPHHRLLLLDLTIRQATYLSSSLDLADPYLEPSCPLYHRPLISYLANMPYSWLQGRSFYRRWTQESMDVIRRQNGFDLSRIRHHAPAVLLLWLNRGMNTLGTPHSILDWDSRFEQSRRWIERTVRSCDDSVAKAICEASLGRKKDKHYLALFMLPVCLATSSRSV